eukprot:3981767-Amphidinium_carterae.1
MAGPSRSSPCTLALPSWLCHLETALITMYCIRTMFPTSLLAAYVTQDFRSPQAVSVQLTQH